MARVLEHGRASMIGEMVALFLACALLPACGGAGATMEESPAAYAGPGTGSVPPSETPEVTTPDQPSAPPVTSDPELPAEPPVVAEPGLPVEPPVATDPTLPLEPPVVAQPDAPAEPSVEVTFATATGDGTFQPVTSASIAATQAMYVVAEWTGVADTATEQLQLLTPKAQLFFATSFPLAPSESQPQVVVLADGTVRAIYRIGIWGTTIAQYRRTGTWTAHVQLEGSDVGAAATVELLP